MSKQEHDFAKILDELINGEAQTKVAADAGEQGEDAGEATSIEKIAEELNEAGRLMADSFTERFLEHLKTAMDGGSGLPSSHAAPEKALASDWGAVVEKLKKHHASKKPSGAGAGQTRAEDVYKRVAKKAPGVGAETGRN